LRIFRKSVEKVRVLLKSDENNGYFTWRTTDIYDISLNFFLMRNVSDKSLEKIKTRILCSVIFFSKTAPFCEIGSNVEECCRAGQSTDDNIIRHSRDAICMPDN
jgi:hypothetical protein